MENFSLEKYNTGKYDVVTRDGRKVRILCTDREVKTYKLVALVSKIKKLLKNEIIR